MTTHIEDYARERTELEIRKELVGMSEKQKSKYLSAMAVKILTMLDDKYYPVEFFREKGFYREGGK